MKLRYLIIITLLFLACKSAVKDRSVLTKNEMAIVLWDMIQVDELATLRLVKDTGKDVRSERIQLYQKVFRLHKTSEAQFSKSFSYYVNHPDLMKQIFDTLDARGIRERQVGYLSKDSLTR